MKILLTTLNAKYVHTSLALWYLYQYCRCDYPELLFREFNINQDLDWVAGAIYLEKAAVIGFSCNIWNIEETLRIGERIKTLAPNTTIILGGPEVWHEPEKLMRDHSWIDFIIIGEGEQAFREWLTEYKKTRSEWSTIKGLIYRDGAQTSRTQARAPLADLNELPFPYPEDLSLFKKKLVYYESSRGCPNHCQYCLSANEPGVRFLPLDRVKRELLRFVTAGIAQVKLVDRSFNCHPGRAKEIWQFLIDHPGETNFHFEIVGDLLDDEAIAILKTAPPGLFQFEIGVQSTNPHTLELIQRKMNFLHLSGQVGKLIAGGNVFVHLDLIAGLPGEDYQSFTKSCNDNLALNPDRLQLGFLKLLKGSGLRARAAEFGYHYTPEAPYEVLSNPWISYDQLLKLKTIEDLLERYFNSGRFRSSLAFLLARSATPFAFFETFADWWRNKGYDQIAHKTKDLYGYLLDFYKTWEDGQVWLLRDLLKFDLLSGERLVELPEWAAPYQRPPVEFTYSFWQEPGKRDKLIPELEGLSLREVQRRVLFAEFESDPLAVAAQPLVNPTSARKIILFIYGKGKTRTVAIT